MNKQLKSILLKYYVMSFFGGMHLFGAVLIPFYTQWGKITPLGYQSLQSWFTFWIFILEIPTGVIADCFGRKISVTLGYLVTIMAVIIYSSTPNIIVFAIGELLFAVGAALISGADNALLSDTLKEYHCEEKTNELFGKAHTYYLVGLLVGTLIGSVIASRFGLQYPMLFTGIPMAIAALVTLTIPEPGTRTIKEVKRYKIIVSEAFKFIQTSKNLQLLLVNGMLVATAGYFVIWIYQKCLEVLIIPTAYYGLFQAGLFVAEMIVAANFKRLISLCGGIHQYLNISAVITAISFFLIALMPSLLTVILFLIIAGGFGLTRIKLIEAEINKAAGSEAKATVASSAAMIRRLATTIANPLVGWGMEMSIPTTLIFIGLVPLLVLLLPKLKFMLISSELNNNE
jgi:MFS family permease